MEKVAAQQDLEAAMTFLLPLVSFVTESSCHEATAALLNALREALEGQEAAARRAQELKAMNPLELVKRLTPGRGVNRGGGGGGGGGGGAGPTRPAPAAPQFALASTGAGSKAAPDKAAAPKVAPPPPPAQAAGKSKTHKKRARKITEKAKRGDKEEEKEEYVEEVDGKAARPVRKQKLALQPWSPDEGERWNVREYPIVVAMYSCDAGEGFQLRLRARSLGEGAGVGSFRATAADLAAIDLLSEETRKLLVRSFRAALGKRFRIWPKILKRAVADTRWAQPYIAKAATDNSD